MDTWSAPKCNSSIPSTQFKRLRHVPKQTMAKETLLRTTCMQTFEKWHEIKVDPRTAIWKHVHTKTSVKCSFCKISNDFFKSFSSASRRGMLYPHLKNNSFLGCTSKLDSPFLPRGFFHSWWPHIKLSRHSWLLYVEFRLSICTRLASSEPTLLQCSFGGTRWRTLEVCRQ